MLAYQETGKYVSERHAEAAAQGKMTAGQMAKLLNQRFSIEPKITARELKPLASEWHHSGFYKGRAGSTMGRTYFFAVEMNLDELCKSVCDQRGQAAKQAAEAKVVIHKFSAGFRRGYGRRRWVPVAKFEAIEVAESELYQHSDTISPEDYQTLKKFAGEELEAYETFEHFKSRMLTKEAL